MKQKLLPIIAAAAILVLFAVTAMAQVTTSGITGTVHDSQGGLVGATVKATHTPSGTVYFTTTQNGGNFTIQGMRVGGPYEIEVSFVGLNTEVITDVNLLLGEPFSFKVTLQEGSLTLGEAVVIGSRKSVFGVEKTGGTTNVSSQQIKSMPSINRSLGDLTRLSPYSSGTGSFGGRPAYTTNITVDGANFNNNFGLSSSSMPGPSASSGDPISMDAIEEMQVTVAPYDVRQSNFTGAGINVVTKSGTNDFKGSAYIFFRNQDFNGKKIRDKKLSVNESEKQVYGVTLGGPIIKNKLFFFVSGEIENNKTPGNTLLAGGPGRDPEKDLNINTRVTGAQLQDFSDFLDTKFGYKTGRYENWGGDNEGNKKLLAKLDWNINNDHKASVRYNFSRAESVSRPSSAGDATPSISGGRHSRTGGMTFENSQYRSAGKLHSITGELNSRFSNRFSNNLLVAYTSYHQPRETDSQMFPFIDIMDGSKNDKGEYLGTVLMSAGYELFSYGNEVKNNTLIITDNLTVHLGKHTLTGGLSYENQYVANGYMRQGTGYYRFKDLQAFKDYADGRGAGQAYNPEYHPLNFGFTYPINGNTNSKAELTFGQFSAYAQDEWNINEAFKLTYGLRVDVPMYLSGAVDNPALKGQAFQGGQTVDLSSWPKTKVLWSPRLGFSYNVTENKSIKLRGGVGIFTGRIPFVWFVNQPQNSGMLQYQLVINNTDGTASQNNLARIPFAPDAYDLLKDPSIENIFPKQNVVGGRIASISKDFKLPQVFRTSLAADFKLPLDMMLTLEGMYTKDINAVRFENINMADPTTTLTEGDLSRPYSTTRYHNTTFQNVIMMKNTSKGYSYSLSAQLTLPYYNGFSGTLAYTYSHSKEVTGKNGSDPFSAWQYRHMVNSPNSQEMGLTLNNTPHRIVASGSYQIAYAKHFKSTFSLFYNGYKGGALSFLYSTDANGDRTTNDLMYIPKNREEFIWKNGSADADAYFAYAANDPYLKKNAGKYAERYAAYLPFYHRLDFRFLQDFNVNVAGKRNTLQLSLDVLNLLNLFSSKWGINQTYIGSNSQVTPLKFEGRDGATGKPIVSMNMIDSKNNIYMTKSYQDPSSVSSTWNIQIGLRYIFN